MNMQDLIIALDMFDNYNVLDRCAKENGKTRIYICDHDDAIDVDCHEDCGKSTSSKPSLRNILDDVKHVIYNDPATIVTFSDGTTVCVKACEKDKFSKETGLIYAIVKRLYANDIEEKTNYLLSRGLGEKISKIVDNAVDQKELERQRRAKRKAKAEKKAALEAEKAAKAKLANEVSEKAAKEAVEQIYNDEKGK